MPEPVLVPDWAPAGPRASDGPGSAADAPAAGGRELSTVEFRPDGRELPIGGRDSDDDNGDEDVGPPIELFSPLGMFPSDGSPSDGVESGGSVDGVGVPASDGSGGGSSGRLVSRPVSLVGLSPRSGPLGVSAPG